MAPVNTKSKPKSVKKQSKSKPKFTEKELNLPKLNTSKDPVGVEKRRGKKGKKFVQDKEAMMSILAQVNDIVEGQTRTKLQKTRDMEIIRETKRAEEDARITLQQSKLEEAKQAVKKRRLKKKKVQIDESKSKVRFAD